MKRSLTDFFFSWNKAYNYLLTSEILGGLFKTATDS